MDELSSEPTRQRPSVCLFLCPEAPFFMDGCYRGSAVVFGKSSRKAHWIEEPVGRQRKEPSAGSRLMVNL